MSFLRTLLITVTVSLTALLNPTSAHAAQSYDNCTGFITSLPATITTQGTWCLNADLTTAITSGSAITVAANNVTIDCNDFKLGGLAAGPGTRAYGIYANTRDNVTIRRCNVRGFYEGAFLDYGSGQVVEDNRFDSNTYIGINVYSERSIIRRNLVVATGGSTAYQNPYGIYTYGSVDVLDNTVNGVTTPATAGVSNTVANGIYTSHNSNGSISGNRVRGVAPAGTGASYGIYNESSGRIIIRNNEVVGDGIAHSVGLACASTNSQVQSQALGNVIIGFASGVGLDTGQLACGGTGGGNVIVP
jgi:parallel beta-helix repeat protein